MAFRKQYTSVLIMFLFCIILLFLAYLYLHGNGQEKHPFARALKYIVTYPKGFTYFKYEQLCLDSEDGDTGCKYPEDVDFRVIVMAYDRADSLSKCLESLKPLELDGDRGAIDIWLDRHSSGGIHSETLKVAQAFTWPQGTVKVHTHREHAGIIGNWIETWRPKVNTTEMALFLEDDTDVSPFAYRWLKTVNKKYGNISEVGGFSLFEKGQPGLKQKPTNDTAFFFRRIGTNGYSPLARHWRAFQDWYHEKRADPSFHPYVKNDPTPTGWYKMFEKKHTEMNMWEMWPICYHDTKTLYTVFPNIDAYVTAQDPSSKLKGCFFGYHRQENGLHFHGKGVASKGHLIMEWKPKFIERIPDNPKKYFYNGSPIN